jgi:predicted nucleic acid-binding protein
MAKAQKLLKSFTILPFTPKISELFVDIFNCYNLSHRPTLPDMLIASTALHYKYPLYTLNKKDFTFLQDLKLV